MAFNLRNRNFLKLLDFTPKEIKFLLDLSMDLKKAKYSGTEQQRLKGKNIALIFEKGFIASHHFGIFPETFPNAAPKPDNTFHPIGGKKGITENFLCFLADTIHTARPLHQTDNGPG